MPRNESLITVEVVMPAELKAKAVQATWMSGFVWGALLILTLFVLFGRKQ